MKKLILAIGVLGCLAVMVYGLAAEPSEWFKTSHVGWIAARAIAFVISVVLGMLTYFGGDLGSVARELRAETGYVTGKTPDGLRTTKGIAWVFASAPMLCWILSWVIAFQAMMFFWVSDWCKYGF